MTVHYIILYDYIICIYVYMFIYIYLKKKQTHNQLDMIEWQKETRTTIKQTIPMMVMK